MRSKTGVLVAIKIFQLVGSTACLSLHIYAYSTGLDVPHITVFCGTYMGFGLVNVAFLVSAVMGKPAAEELDMAFGVIGSCLFYICGVIGMYQVRQRQLVEQERIHSLELPNAYDIDPRFFMITRAQAICSVMTALTFVYDACLKFDMWKYEWDVRRNRLAHDAFDPPDLRLFCFRPCDSWYRSYKRKKEEREADIHPPTLLVTPSISVQRPTQPLRGASPSGETRRRTRSVDPTTEYVALVGTVPFVQTSPAEENAIMIEHGEGWISSEKGGAAEESLVYLPPKQTVPPEMPPPPSPPPVPVPSPTGSSTPRARTLRAAPARDVAMSPPQPSKPPQAPTRGAPLAAGRGTVQPPQAGGLKPSRTAESQSRSRKPSPRDLLGAPAKSSSSSTIVLSSSSNASMIAKESKGTTKEKVAKRNQARTRRE